MGIEYDIVRDDNLTTFELGRGHWYRDAPSVMPAREGVIAWIRTALDPSGEPWGEYVGHVADLLLAFAPPGTAVYIVNDCDDSISPLLDAADRGTPYSEIGTRYEHPHEPRPYAGYAPRKGGR